MYNPKEYRPAQTGMHGDIVLFLGDAASRHQRFSRRALHYYLEAEGHQADAITRAMQDWWTFWRSDFDVGQDEFIVAARGWEQVGSTPR